MSVQAGRPGYESGVPAPERRAFFDLTRRLALVESMLGLGGGGMPAALDEVWINNSPPAAPENYELWYDPDASGVAVQQSTINISMASRTLTATLFTMGTIDFGVKTYDRLMMATAQAYFTIDAAAAYWNLGAQISGDTPRYVRTRQVSQPCSALSSSMKIVAAGASGVINALCNTNVSATGSTTGSVDYNILQAWAIPVSS